MGLKQIFFSNLKSCFILVRVMLLLQKHCQFHEGISKEFCKFAKVIRLRKNILYSICPVSYTVDVYCHMRNIVSFSKQHAIYARVAKHLDEIK